MSPRKPAAKKPTTTKKPATKKAAAKKAATKKAATKKAAAKKAVGKTRGPVERATKATPTARKTGRAIEKKAEPGAASSKRPSKRQEPERVKVGGLRTLGDVEPSSRERPTASRSTVQTRKARQVLEQEFERALALKEKLAAEAAIGGKEKGRAASRQQEKLRAIINSLEGMNRFAMQMGLIAPAEARELYAKAMSQGLYEGWK